MQKSITNYETTLIFRPDIGENNKKTFIDKLKGIIAAHDGEVLGFEDWGKRKLAYTIQKENRGYYIHMNYTGNNDLVEELERNLRLNEQVIRFLTVKIAVLTGANKFEYKPTIHLRNEQARTAAAAAYASSAPTQQ